MCERLPPIVNGKIAYETDMMSPNLELGNAAFYRCAEGYRLIGGDKRTCVDGGDGNGRVFNGTEPFCERKERRLNNI